ncbi:hypothetical protein EVAR_22177_1 [Eumeta japonica]|uniref:Uncharacterized protein n=1 Tax=Eumeta variegata TaxID=151549 RepID=A0A4C1Y025_EUMVA|nr:hypothetical protein EVAR_22177_1 [Eumeta japonica]
MSPVVMSAGMRGVRLAAGVAALAMLCATLPYSVLALDLNRLYGHHTKRSGQHKNLNFDLLPFYTHSSYPFTARALRLLMTLVTDTVAIESCVRPLSLFYSDASANGVEERSLVPRFRSYARLGRNATINHVFSCVQPAFIDL